MDSKSLSETYDIINLMDIRYQKKIPKALKEFIKNNREILFDTGIKELPKSVENLRRETIVFLSIIYEKYISGTELDVSNEYKIFLNNRKLIKNNHQELKLEIMKKDESPNFKEGLIIREKFSFKKLLLGIKKFFSFFKKRRNNNEKQ